MPDEERRRRRSTHYGCGCGGGGFVLVLTLGIVLSLFHVVISASVSLGVPFTSSNLTLGGALGQKGKVATAFPEYTYGRLGGNQNFINSSQLLTIGPAEGAILVVLGHQEGAPAVDLHLVAH